MDKEVFYDGLSFTKDEAIKAIEDHTARYLRSKKGDFDFYQSHRYAYDLISLLTDNQLIDFNESSAFLEKLIYKPA